ncbi:MAG: response regulator [Chloroherpetonaceae bacterium]|nr:response regulator [Chloroherpetonaceae bacterium]MCS7210156.1 response regulator [Chloroherpetonaceae bacterium]MDW8019253.1 response regulator [Chloroherpetonaceae bacterium]MDW8467498.1 response regulator [Chloroherpetonaceae bacterium]
MPSRLLFVDDEPNVLLSLTELFREERPYTAQRARDALDILRKHPEIDVIVTDQRMPTMTGVEFLREAKKINPIAIRILLTGYSDLNEVLSSVNTGEVYRYILKPWDVDKLRSTVKLAMELAQRTRLIMPKAPVAQPTATSAPAGTNSSSSSANHTRIFIPEKLPILVIDNNQSHLASMRDLFAENYVVNISSTAQSAIEILKRTPMAAIITELSLPDTDPVKFLSEVKSFNPNTPIIVLSSMKDSGLAIQLINQVQIFRYLVRPLRRDTLESTVQTAVELYKTYTATPGLNLKNLETSILKENERKP